MSRGHILLVDDEPMVREVVERYLTREGYLVSSAADGRTALTFALEHELDLIVLDLMLPQLDGLEICRRVREVSAVPIIMLTARGDEMDKIVGFGLGADDYLVKPFGPRELVARVQAILRRSQPAAATLAPPARPLRFGELSINPSERRVERSGRTIDLTPKEFDLLVFMASHPSRVFRREELLDHVWDYGYEGDSSTVTVHMRRLREKVEITPMQPRHLKTVWGVGYKFEP